MSNGRHYTTKSKKKADAFVEARKGKGFYVKKLKSKYGVYKD